MSELFHRIRRPGAVLASACLLRLALLTSRLNEGSHADRWLDILLWLVITCSLVVIGHRTISCFSRTSGARRGNEHVGCLWWDDCLTDASGVGYVIVRDENGLTMAGQQRVARAIVAGVQ